MSAIFILKKEPPKYTSFSFFLKSRYFVMGALLIRMLVGFLKSVVSQLIPNVAKVISIRMSKIAQNLTAWTGGFSFFHLGVTCRTL